MKTELKVKIMSTSELKKLIPFLQIKKPWGVK